MNSVNAFILAIGVAVLLFGCTGIGAKAKEAGPSGNEGTGAQNGAGAGTSNTQTGTVGTGAGADTQAAFGELDSFAATDTAVVDPDPGADFSFDATGLQ